MQEKQLQVRKVGKVGKVGNIGKLKVEKLKVGEKKTKN